MSHIKHSVKLRTLMREINELSLARLPQEMGTSLSQRRRVSSVGAIAERLAASTTELPKMAGELDLSEAQKTSFIELAGYLREEAQELGRIARKGADSRLVQRKLDEMVTTCNACHRLFRDPAAGTLVSPREF
ncbi:MAG: cytochrome c [Phycisphaerales bacterium]|nr:cytochrome c [Phycisphaerales bacterium]